MGVHTLTRQMNVRVPPADNSGTIIILLIVLVIVGVVGYRVLVPAQGQRRR